MKKIILLLSLGCGSLQNTAIAFDGSSIALGVGTAAVGIVLLPTISELTANTLGTIVTPLKPLWVDKADTRLESVDLKIWNKNHLIKNESSYIAIEPNTGKLLSWGSSTDGLLGLGDIASVSTSTYIPEMHDFIALTSGYHHILALNKHGRVWSWGKNAHYQLGYDTELNAKYTNQRVFLDQKTPLAIDELHNIISISSSKSSGISFALDNQGNVYNFGTDRAVCNPSTPCDKCDTSIYKPQKIGFIQDAVKIQSHFHHLIVQTSTNQLSMWKLNDNGANQKASISKVQEINIPEDVVDFYVQNDFNSYKNVTALLKDGSVWVYGNNQKGQLGQGDYKAYEGFQKVKHIPPIVSLICQEKNCLALDQQSRIWQWGDELLYQSKIGNLTQHFYNPYAKIILESKKSLKSIFFDSGYQQSLYGLSNDNSVIKLTR